MSLSSATEYPLLTAFQDSCSLGDHKCLSTTDIAPYSHTDNLELRLRSQEPRYQTAGDLIIVVAGYGSVSRLATNQ